MKDTILEMFEKPNTNFKEFEISIKNIKHNYFTDIKDEYLKKEICKTIVSYLTEKLKISEIVKKLKLENNLEPAKLASLLNIPTSFITIHGDKITILDKKYSIADIMTEKLSEDDLRLIVEECVLFETPETGKQKLANRLGIDKTNINITQERRDWIVTINIFDKMYRYRITSKSMMEEIKC